MSFSVPTEAQVISTTIIAQFEAELTANEDHQSVFNKYNANELSCETRQKLYKAYSVFLWSEMLDEKFLSIQRDSLLPMLIHCYGPKDSLLTRTYRNIARAYEVLNQPKQAEEYYLKLVNLIEELPYNTTGATTQYRDVAEFYLYDNDLHKALLYIDKGISSHKQSKYQPLYLQMLRQKGNTQNLLGYYDESKQTFKEAMAFIGQTKNLDNETYINLLTDYASVLRFTKEFDEAQRHLFKAISLSPNKTPTEKLKLARVLKTNYGQLLLERNNFKAAHNTWKEISQDYQKLEDLPTTYDLTVLNENIADTYLRNGDHGAAISYYNKAISLLIPFNAETPLDNPILLNRPIIDDLSLQRLMGLKSLAVYEYANTTGDVNYYKAALETVTKYDTICEMVLKNNWDEESHQFQISKSRTYYNNAVEAALKTYKLNGDKQYISKAREIGSRFKAQLLKRGINLKESISTELSTELQAEEKTLRSNKENAEIAYKNSLSDGQKTMLNDNMNNFFKHKAAYDKFLFDNKVYETLNNDGYETLSDNSLQSMLSEDEVIIEYVRSKEKLYAFLISNKKTIFSESLMSAQEVQNFHSQILNTDLEDDNSKFSKKLIGILDDVDSEKIKHLIIIPDGDLLKLPFESLETNGSRLIDQAEVSYEYSTSFFRQESNIKGNGQILGMASDYTKDIYRDTTIFQDGPLSKLPNTIKELESITEIVSGDMYLNNNATKAKFFETANNYSVLHIALHSLLDDTYPDLSSVIFESDSTDLFLRSSEIYNSEINTQLTVLSTCNSGVGEIVDGDGARSLARSFIHAGSQSVLLSLWEANDYSTGLIMQEFYKGLKSGQSKSAALRQAKLSYLDTAHPSKQHPKYWAHLILVGNTEAIKLANAESLKTWRVTLTIIVVLLLLVKLIINFVKNKPTNRSMI